MLYYEANYVHNLVIDIDSIFQVTLLVCKLSESCKLNTIMKAHTAWPKDLKLQKLCELSVEIPLPSQFLEKPLPPQLSLNPSLFSTGHDHLAVYPVQLGVTE
jgi:hypothetical protein